MTHGLSRMSAVLLLVVMLVGAMLGGCDREGRPVQQFGLEKLSLGTSSEADVRTVMGQPETTWEEENGARILEYPKGPEGARTWIFSIDPAGKLVEYHQALTPENLARIRPGMRRDDVRRLLGKPRTVVPFNRLNEEVWDYRFLDNQQARLFNVHMDQTTGKVTKTSTSDIGN
ncbi:MAG: outer membrane protein assembly factor BamE [Herminiimonas sp.]|nr:outer membrane protein assembly factor BamE [Herminiimonas sp.]